MLDEFYEIYDSSTGELLTKGQVIARKSHSPKFLNLRLVSLDGRWFFNEDSPIFNCIKCGAISKEDYVPFVKQDDYEWEYWRNWDTDSPFALYRDFDITEIDEEVKPLVHELNKWKGIRTVGSCCGHGHGPLWIQFYCHDSDSLDYILNILRSPKVFPKMLDTFYLSMESKYISAMLYHDCIFSPNHGPKEGGTYLVLMSTHTGEQAYKDAELYARYLEEIRESNDMTKKNDGERI